MEKHMRFICPECGDQFCTQQEWRTHLNDDHEYSARTHTDFDFKEINERYHECLICQKWVANARNAIALLQYHRFLHLPYSRTYRCRHCTGAFTRKRALCEHLNRFHSRQIERLEKQHRSESVFDVTSMTDPKENPEFYLRFVCPQCGAQLDRFEQWRQHLNTHSITSTEMHVHRITGTQKHYCLHCKKAIVGSDKESLQRHCFGHMPYKEYFKCAFCTVRKTYKEEVMRHFVYMHPLESAAAKGYLKKPKEWGGRASEQIINELDVLLCGDKNGNNGSTNKQEQTDLIQKALLDSLIDLESETKPNTKPNSKSARENALDQSLDDLEAILRDDLQKQPNTLLQSQSSAEGLDDCELEQLYKDIFEEIEPKASTNDVIMAVNQAKKHTLSKAELEEQVISIEIDAVDEHEDATFQAPRLKRLKFDNSNIVQRNSKTIDEEVIAMMEAHIKYLCPQCGKEFDQQANWRQHVFNAHNLADAIRANFKPLDSSSYLCLECMDVLNSTKHADLQRHHFMHMPFQSYLKCTACNKTKSSKPKMLQHLHESHDQLLTRKQQQPTPDFKCQCGKTFQTQLGWQKHHAGCRPRSTATSLYNINQNRKLLIHLRKARKRICKILAEDLAPESNRS